MAEGFLFMIQELHGQDSVQAEHSGAQERCISDGLRLLIAGNRPASPESACPA
jgi:hypothetical protein